MARAPLSTSKPAVVFAAFQTGRGSNGGMESATQIFEALADDFAWTLLTNADTARTRRWRDRGARVIVQPLSESAPRPVRAIQLGLWSLRLHVLARRGKPVLHSNDIRAAQALMPVARMTGQPLLHTFRDTKPPGETYGPHWHKLARQADRTITLSDEMAQMVAAALPLPPERITTINSIVDLARFKPADDAAALRAGLGLDPAQIAIGIVAGVFAKKGQLEFLKDVVPALIAQHPQVHIHLIGDHDPARNPYSDACAQAVQAAGLQDHVTFHGFTDRVADWLAALDILAVPSLREGLARCMIEAMACGTPVVSNDVCSATEMLEDTGAGRVVDFGDAPAMTRALLDLIADRDLRASMGRKGRDTAKQRFAIATLADQWRDLYRAAAAKT